MFKEFNKTVLQIARDGIPTKDTTIRERINLGLKISQEKKNELGIDWEKKGIKILQIKRHCKLQKYKGIKFKNCERNFENNLDVLPRKFSKFKNVLENNGIIDKLKQENQLFASTINTVKLENLSDIVYDENDKLELLNRYFLWNIETRWKI